MKLSKKNAALQRAMQKAIASGKALGGLLVGITAATVAGGCREHSPASTMGSYPRPQQQANATNENIDEFFTDGEIVRPEDIAVPEAKPAEPKPNAVRERRGKEIVLGGKPSISPPPPLPPGQYRVKYGDTLSKIAKAHGTTVAELKRLNGFDDVRANNLIMGEIIKVPPQKSNAVNEDRSETLHVKGRYPAKRRYPAKK